ncbi:DUF2802 domain-containing protein [Azonexus sp.]|uniref:DUF2802 domain-containing protein n=1 Tax=Azonexus sp. TaxID=1872668 RepID=UPI0039E24275
MNIAGMSLGLREGVLLLIVLVAFYIGRVLWRMRHIEPPTARQTAGVPEAPVPAPDDALTHSARERETERAAQVLEEDLAVAAHSSASARAADFAAQAQEISLLRDEVDILRSELAALRKDMQHDLGQMRVAQNVSPLYGDAMQMALAGHTAEMIAERCGIARAEAELVVALTQNQATNAH